MAGLRFAVSMQRGFYLTMTLGTRANNLRRLNTVPRLPPRLDDLDRNCRHLTM